MLYYNYQKRERDKEMTKDWMHAATMMDYTAFDIHYAAFKRGQKKKIEQMARRKARHVVKNNLKNLLTNNNSCVIINTSNQRGNKNG